MGTAHWVAVFRAPLVNPAEQIRLAEPRSFADETLPAQPGWVAAGDRTSDAALPIPEEIGSRFFLSGGSHRTRGALLNQGRRGPAARSWRSPPAQRLSATSRPSRTPPMFCDRSIMPRASVA